MHALKSNPTAMWLCAAGLVLVVVLVIAGALGAWFLLAAIPCALMMGAMVWMMVSMARHGGGHGGT
jgi:4-hydroxybenzoate polyprenyltransferase